jgi:hypothetical protein
MRKMMTWVAAACLVLSAVVTSEAGVFGGKDGVICMLCGKEMKTLPRHLKTAHGLKPSEYSKQFILRYGVDDPDYDKAAETYLTSAYHDPLDTVLQQSIDESWPLKIKLLSGESIEAVVGDFGEDHITLDTYPSMVIMREAIESIKYY